MRKYHCLKQVNTYIEVKKSYGLYFLWAKKKNNAKAGEVTGEEEIWCGTLGKNCQDWINSCV